MAAQQAFQWAALYSPMVRYLVTLCGCAKTSVHNYVFLEGLKAPLLNDPAFNHGNYKHKSEVQKGLRGMARVYAGWVYSQAFYRARLFESALGYASIEDFLVGFWEGYFLKKVRASLKIRPFEI